MTVYCNLLLLAVVSIVAALNSSPTEEFKSLVEKYWAWRNDVDPNVRSITKHTQSLYVNLSPAALQDQAETAEALLEMLEDINVERLSDTDSLDALVLKSELRTFIDGYPHIEFKLMNILKSGTVTNVLGIRTRERNLFRSVEDYIRHEQDIEDYKNLAEIVLSKQRKAVQLKATHHNISMGGVIDDLAALIPSSYSESKLYQPYTKQLDDVKDIEDWIKDRLRERAQNIINDVINILQELHHFMATDYLSNTRSGVGLGNVPGGEEFYAAVLKWHITTDMTPSQVHEMGKVEVERLLEKMTKLKDKMGYTNNTVLEFLNICKSNPENYLDNIEDVVAIYQNTIKETAPMLLETFFDNVPNYAIRVVPTKDLGVAAAYSDGELYVDSGNPKLLPKFSHRSVCLHESIPGHHTQGAHNKVIERRDFRKAVGVSSNTVPFAFPRKTAYVEGWALYAESLGEEVDNVFKNDLEMLGRYSEEMFRAVRLVIDTGLHVFGWSREKAIKYMMDHTIEPPKDASNEIDRYISDPGQAAGYKVGERNIKDFRADAEHELGKDFDLRKFNTMVIETGVVSMGVLKEATRRWINTQKSNASQNLDTLNNYNSKYKTKLTLSAQIIVQLLLRGQSPNLSDRALDRFLKEI